MATAEKGRKGGRRGQGDADVREWVAVTRRRGSRAKGRDGFKIYKSNMREERGRKRRAED